jgi:hypothetical protein
LAVIMPHLADVSVLENVRLAPDIVDHRIARYRVRRD